MHCMREGQALMKGAVRYEEAARAIEAAVAKAIAEILQAE